MTGMQVQQTPTLTSMVDRMAILMKSHVGSVTLMCALNVTRRILTIVALFR